MRAGSTQYRLSSWLAIAAMVFNALWPLIANAQPASAPSLMEICTSQGIKPAADGPGAPSDSGTKHLQPHCPLCSFGTDKVAAATSQALGIPVAIASRQATAAASSTAEPRNDSYSPAQPRAPPYIS